MEDWDKFEDKYPYAYSFLLHASLIGEKKSLTRELKLLEDGHMVFNLNKDLRKQWIKSRLEDLSEIE